jgi:DNA-binding transcriptional LysR family regulator
VELRSSFDVCADVAELVLEAGALLRESAFPADSAGRPRVVGEFGSLAAIGRLVESGAGCALVPRLAASDAGGRLVVLRWPGGAEAVPYR